MIAKRNRWLAYSASVILVSTAAFAQMASQPQPRDPGTMNQQPSYPTGPQDSGMPNPQALTDQDFVRSALEGGAAEVRLGQLAQQKSQSDDVKQFGQKMVADHTQLGDKLFKPIAQQIGVKEPKDLSKKDKQLIAKLEGLSGPQFDEEYIKAMLKDHKQDLKAFKSEAQMAQYGNVKMAAQQGTSVVEQHLQLIEQIAQNHNLASPETSSRAQ